MLVPIADPQIADYLIKMAAAIAQNFNYELECIHVVQVARSLYPAETKVDLDTLDPLRQVVNRFGTSSEIPIHFQVRVAHEVGRTLLEVIKERHIDLVLMGWYGKTLTPGRVIGGCGRYPGTPGSLPGDRSAPRTQPHPESLANSYLRGT